MKELKMINKVSNPPVFSSLTLVLSLLARIFPAVCRGKPQISALGVCVNVCMYVCMYVGR
jgi:hypothetical protein